MSQPVIELEGVSLAYRLATQKSGSFKEFLIHMVSGSLTYHDLWALKDIHLKIGKSEVVGIVGANGAGKSTLSKVISNVLKPTRGTCTVRGTVSPILELGTGFDYELTGLENIFLNSLLMGRRRYEVEKKVESIIDFSGLGDFIHSPVRNYSTGMMARLGFSVATAWIPDVLVLDEVLAVGDQKFLKRCHARIENFRQAGTTIIIVSHSPEEIIKHCQRCLWIDKGQLKADGRPIDILGHYADREESGLSTIDGDAPGSDALTRSGEVPLQKVASPDSSQSSNVV